MRCLITSWELWLFFKKPLVSSIYLIPCNLSCVTTLLNKTSPWIPTQRLLPYLWGYKIHFPPKPCKNYQHNCHLILHYRRQTKNPKLQWRVGSVTEEVVCRGRQAVPFVWTRHCCTPQSGGSRTRGCAVTAPTWLRGEALGGVPKLHSRRHWPQSSSRHSRAHAVNLDHFPYKYDEKINCLRKKSLQNCDASHLYTCIP